MSGQRSAEREATGNDRLEALEYLVQALVIGQWARSPTPVVRARADLKTALSQLEAPEAKLSAGAAAEVARILAEALSRLEQDVARSQQAT